MDVVLIFGFMMVSNTQVVKTFTSSRIHFLYICYILCIFLVIWIVYIAIVLCWLFCTHSMYYTPVPPLLLLLRFLPFSPVKGFFGNFLLVQRHICDL